MLSNIHKNTLGTVSFDLKIAKMRKPQEFIVYPVKSEDQTKKIMVQSDTRIGYISLETGAVELAGPVSSGAYGHHLGLRKDVGSLNAEDLFTLKANVFASASGKAGSNGMVYTDNSGALEVFPEISL